MYRIPLFDLNFDESEAKAAYETIRSGWISTGPKCTELESKFSTALNSKYGLTTSSCTGALHLALLTLGIKDGDEVIVPSLTFAATVNSVRYVGAKPVFADITSINDLTIDPEDIEKKINKRTKAIIVMHYAGFPCAMDKIMEIAIKNNLKIIEDAAHAPLSEFKGKKLGTIGDIGCFSFYSNKNISTGEGGMLVTDNEEYFNKAKLLRSHGMTTLSYERSKGHSTSYDVVGLGYNYRMDDIRASIGIVQFDKLRKDLKQREMVRDYYIQALSEITEIAIPFLSVREFVSNHIFPIVLKNSIKEKRNFVREKLAENGIQTSVHYPAVHCFSIYKKYSASLSVTEYVTDNEITLPMYSNLSNEQIVYISNTFKNIFS